jgi:TPR repeat protein
MEAEMLPKNDAGKPYDPLIDEWNSAVQMTCDGKGEEALEVLKRLADVNFPGAYTALGELYGGTHNSVAKNLPTAIFWLRKAMEIEPTDHGRHCLAQALLSGDSLTDHREAVLLAEEGVTNDYLESIVLLATMLDLAKEAGKGIEPNLERAKKLYAIAADRGHLDSMVRLVLIAQKELRLGEQLKWVLRYNLARIRNWV